MMFICPKCGSHNWGTNPITNKGHCQGGPNKLCDFEWKRSKENDAKVIK